MTDDLAPTSREAGGITLERHVPERRPKAPIPYTPGMSATPTAGANGGIGTRDGPAQGSLAASSRRLKFDNIRRLNPIVQFANHVDTNAGWRQSSGGRLR